MRRVALAVAVAAASALAAVGCGAEELPPQQTSVPAPTPASAPSAGTTTAAPAIHLPDVVEIRCTADGTELAAARVRPGPAGVRVRVRNETGAQALTFRGAVGGFGVTAAPGTTEQVVTMAPGRFDVACYDPGDPAQDPPSSPGYLKRVVSLEVVDHDGLWRSDEPECRGGGMVGVAASWAADAGVPWDRLLTDLRTQLHLLPTDELRPAGYPDQAAAALVVVRDGRIVVAIHPEELAAGWVFGELTGCAADGIVE
jgi:hypothetical protein